MEQADVEGTAECILDAGDSPNDEPPAIGKVARKLLGPDCFRTAMALPGDAALARVYNQWFIYLRPKLPPVRKTFNVAHEVVEYWISVVEPYHGEDVEAFADAVAAAVLCPRRAFRRVVGLPVQEQAEAFRISQTHAALRESEVTGAPRAVVSPKLVRVRGSEWRWGTENQIRRGAHPSPGLVKTRLTDDPRRFVLDPVAP